MQLSISIIDAAVHVAAVHAAAVHAAAVPAAVHAAAVSTVLSCEERLRTAQNCCFLREKRLGNAQGRGLYEANAGHAPRRMVC